MSNKKLAYMSFYTDKDMYCNYAYIESTTPFKLLLTGFSAGQLNIAVKIIIEYTTDDYRVTREFKFDKQEGEYCYLTPLSEEMRRDTARALTITYNNYYNFIFFDDTQLQYNLQKADYVNMTERSSISNRIRQSMPTENADNRIILKFMMELNNKLDDILDILKPTTEEVDSVKIRGVGVNINEIILFSPIQLPVDKFIYSYNVIGEGEDRFRFASVMKIKEHLKTSSGYFYEAIFTKISDDVKDRILKFVFSRERDMIKSLKEHN